MLAIEGIQTSKFSDLFGKRGMEFLMGVKTSGSEWKCWKRGLKRWKRS